ncbi:hypothetical protein D0469_19380 [Peribacillus saganii]|uniref:Uncharacterized protein n=1 Tax=Peribacillus saganii TaxID=2303992 RepID=A0A372LEG6_9BACI|nr:hypothetical protein [Peribacillus saganii]RFU63690.1 hypothetical protein D0469_19380 [Peribacillus saganii]
MTTVKDMKLTLNEVKLVCCFESTQEVISFLVKKGYWNDDNVWRYLGDTENNYSSIGNQQSHPVSSIVEKVVNAFDAILMNAGREMAIDLYNILDPAKTKENILKYIQESNSTASDIKKVKEDISRLVAISLTGGKHPDNPNVTIADRGEGQTPDSLPDTILSLGKSNKIRIPIVQGKHNMGGSGVAKFTELQVIVTRKNPALINSTNPRDDQWAFTVIRRTPPTGNMRSSVVEYLAPIAADSKPKKGSVLGFEADTFAIMPNARTLCGTEVEYGTFIKLFDYEVGVHKTSILLDNGLGHAIKMRLPKMTVPVRFCEFREFRAQGSKNVFADGLLDYFTYSRQGDLEEGFPTHASMTVHGETLTCSTYVFKRKTLSKFLRGTGVIFSLNGQTHAMLDKTIYSRKRLKLNEIKDDTLTIIDCSHLTNAAIEKLFMNSRDRLVDSPFAEEVKKELENYLANEAGLKRLNEARIQEMIKISMADNKPLADALKKVVKNTEVLNQLLDLGNDISGDEGSVSGNNEGEGSGVGKFGGKETPTFFRFYGQQDEYVFKGSNQEGKKSRIKFETDANNDLFTREGSDWKCQLLLLQSDSKLTMLDHTLNLINGNAFLSFNLPSVYKENDEVKCRFDVKSDATDETFSNVFELIIIKPYESSGGGGGGGGSKGNTGSNTGIGNAPSKSKLKLPNMSTVTKDDWEQYGFNAKRVLKIIDSTESLNFVFNIDNTVLKSEVRSARESLKDLTKSKFIYGMTMLGLAAYSLVKEENEGSKGFNSLEDVEKICEAYAPFIIPTLNMLNSITGVED